MSHQGSPLSNKRDFSVGSLCAQSPPMDTVIVPPPLPSWGSPSASLSAWGEGAPQPLPWGSHRPENQVCLPEDVIVQIMHSPLIIASPPAFAERHTED